MKLDFLKLSAAETPLRAAPLERDWMEATPDRFAYRCLPLNIANQMGWQILSPISFTAIWDGRDAKDAIRLTTQDDAYYLPVSHFGSGVLTFHIHGLLVTEEGWDLFVCGPTNAPKDGISALSGVVETDWAHMTFTMNWVFTRAHHPVAFAAGEPICQFFPIPRGATERFTPRVRPIAEAPEVKAKFDDWLASRNTFNADLADPESAARQQKWQREYFQGRGCELGGEIAHRTKLRNRDFSGS